MKVIQCFTWKIPQKFKGTMAEAFYGYFFSLIVCLSFLILDHSLSTHRTLKVLSTWMNPAEIRLIL
jgi:hypothetical protein